MRCMFLLLWVGCGRCSQGSVLQLYITCWFVKPTVAKSTLKKGKNSNEHSPPELNIQFNAHICLIWLASCLGLWEQKTHMSGLPPKTHLCATFSPNLPLLAYLIFLITSVDTTVRCIIFSWVVSWGTGQIPCCLISLKIHPLHGTVVIFLCIAHPYAVFVTVIHLPIWFLFLFYGGHWL